MTRQELIAINVDLNCSQECEFCEKFFDCNNPARLKIYERRRMARAREVMAGIKYKIIVVGGKGGVGKSLVTTSLAAALALRNYRVTILDQDFDGPSIPKMLGVTGKKLQFSDAGIIPAEGVLGIQLVSTGLIFGSQQVLTWFHDMRRNTTEEFLAHVAYGERDFLLVDMPPGTSSDAVNLMEYIPDITGAVMVTIPSEVSQEVALKAALLCRKAGIRIFGVIENMSGYVCPKCGEHVDILHEGGGTKLAAELKVPLLSSIPLVPQLATCSDQGRLFVKENPDSPASQAIFQAVEAILASLE